MFRLSILIVTAFCSSFLSGCSITRKENMATVTKSNGFEISIKIDDDDPDSANWFVDGMIDKKPYRFLLDTGAGTSTIKYDSYTSSFKPVDKRDSAGTFAKNNDDIIVVPEIRVGSLSQSSVKFARMPSNAQGRKSVLGMNFFKNYALHFLFKNNEVEVVDNAQSIPPVNLLELFLGERFHPYVDLSWDENIHAKGVWDTGAGMTCFNLAFMKKHPHLFTKVGTSIGTDSTGKQMETPVYLLKGFMLGGKRFPDTKVVVIDLSVPNSTIKTPMDFILGYGVLSKADWFFDFPGKRWGITKMHIHPSL